MSADHLERLGLNIAWLAAAITRDHLRAASMAEGRFLFDPDFGDWWRTHYPFPASANTLVVDDIGEKSWLTTQPSGEVTCTVPVQRLLDAEGAGRREDELVEMFAEVFARWAEVNNKPVPPRVGVKTPLPSGFVDSVLSSHGPDPAVEHLDAAPVALRAIGP